MSKHTTRRVLGKLGLGSACAVCCALPMLVLAGLVTGASLAVGGAVLAAIVVVVVGATVLVTTGRADAITSKAQLPLVGIGGTGAIAGLWGISDERTGAAAIVALSVAALTTAALLALAETEVTETQS